MSKQKTHTGFAAPGSPVKSLVEKDKGEFGSAAHSQGLSKLT